MEYKHPCATADVIVERDNKVLLIRRKHEPFRNFWALPGGHINFGKETLEETAKREFGEETGILVDEGKLKADDDAAEVRFFSLENLPELAFDHKLILNDYQKQLKGGSR